MASRYGFVQKFGRTPDMDTAQTNEEVWDGTGVYGGFLAAAAAMTISSSSTADDGTPTAGTGALTVRVIGLNASFNEISQDVTLNGQTGVAIPTSLIRVYRAYVLTVGTGGVNAGDIWIGTGDITTGVPAVKHAGILTGQGQTLMAVYTIPADIGKGGAKILRWYASVGAVQSARASLALQTREFGQGWRTRRTIGIGEGGTFNEWIAVPDPENPGNWLMGIDVSAKCDIRVRVLLNGVNNSTIEAGFDLELRT